jgi:hypothetical protein
MRDAWALSFLMFETPHVVSYTIMAVIASRIHQSNNPPIQ